jgi:hypothetical protein
MLRPLRYVQVQWDEQDVLPANRVAIASTQSGVPNAPIDSNLIYICKFGPPDPYLPASVN